MNASKFQCLALAAALAAALLIPSHARAKSTSRPAHLLSYVVKENTSSGERYHWNFWNPETGKVTPFLDLAKQPRLVFWDTREHLVYYAIGAHIYSATYPRTYALASKVADLPPGPPNDVELMWMERTAGRLRIIVREYIPASSITKKPDGTIVYRLKDGSVASLPADEAEEERPDEVLTVLELDPRGKWRPIARHALGIADDLMTDWDIMKNYWHERGASRGTITKSFLCINAVDCGKDPPKSFVSRLRQADKDTGDDFHYVPPSNGLLGLVFTTVFGDTVHTTPPFFLVSTAGKLLNRIELKNSNTVDASISRQYLLVADEFDGTTPVVIDLKTGRTVFVPKNALDAVWVP